VAENKKSCNPAIDYSVWVNMYLRVANWAPKLGNQFLGNEKPHEIFIKK